MKLCVSLKKFDNHLEDFSFLTETRNGKPGMPIKVVGKLRNKLFFFCEHKNNLSSLMGSYTNYQLGLRYIFF